MRIMVNAGTKVSPRNRGNFDETGAAQPDVCCTRGVRVPVSQERSAKLERTSANGEAHMARLPDAGVNSA